MSFFRLKRTNAERLLAALRNLAAENESVPYECGFQVDANYILPDIKISDYPGLLQFQLVKKGGLPGRLICYWQDENHFQDSKNKFEFAAQVAPPDFEGTVGDIHTKRKKFLQRYSPKAIILGAAAIFGALSAIHDYFAMFFAAPDVTLGSAELGRLDVVENGQIVVPMTIINQVRFVPIAIRLDQAGAVSSTNPKRTQKLEWDVPGLPNVPPGQPVGFKLSGIAPALSVTHGLPELYDLSVKIEAKAGYVWPWRPFTARTRQVKIWPAGAVAGRPRVTRAENDFCQLEGVVYAGRAYEQGLSAEIVATGPPGVLASLVASAAGMKDVQRSSNLQPTSQTFKMEFRTAPLDKFQEYKYEIVLQGAHNFGRQECEQWAGDSRRLDISFQ